MAEDTKTNKTPDAQQEPAMSTGEESVPEPSGTESVPQAEETVSETAEVTEDLKLPENASERTKEQFDKLKTQLQKEKELRLKNQSFVPPASPTEELPLYDSNTGLINVQALEDLQRRTREAEARAQRAEQTVSGYINNKEDMEAFAAYPEVNPNSENFDPKLYDAAEALYMHSMIYPERYGNRKLSQKESIDMAKAQMANRPETAREAAERLTSKEQASLEAVGIPSPALSRTRGESELEDLRKRTRMGDKSAALARLKNIPEEGR